MANIDANIGLRSLRGPSRIEKFYVNSTYATLLAKGDPVLKVAGGSNTAAVISGTTRHEIGTLPSVERAEVGDAITGVIVGVESDPTDLNKADYIAASAGGVVLVEIHPEHIFEIQADGAIGAAAMGLNASVVYNDAATTAPGLSGMELDASTAATTSTLSLNILRASKDMKRNDTTLTKTLVEVRINKHTELAGQAGI